MNYKLYAILRTYNNANVFCIIDNLVRTRLVERIIVVIDATRDSLTASIIRRQKRLVNIIVAEINDYGWALALNHGLQLLPCGGDNEELVLIISNEVRINLRQLKLLIRAALSPEASCGYALFRSRKESTYLIPRNTCMIWRRSVLHDSNNAFDTSLDDLGMEDYDMLLRSFTATGLLPFVGPRDVVLSTPPSREKIEREKAALSFIESRYSMSIVASVSKHIRLQNER
jgi:hypothetical protein